MRKPIYGFILLALSAFSLATAIQPRFEEWDGGRSGSRELMTIAFGESRKMFARHLYAKADAYFHRGYYPSIFDSSAKEDRLAAAATGGGDDRCDSFLGPPRDWLDRFGRKFTPSEHTHLGDDDHDHDHGQGRDHDHDHGHDHGSGHDHDHDHDHSQCDDHDHDGEGKGSGGKAEMLPWLKLAAEMDPNRPETYVVAAYWLRSHLGKVDAAEEFIRNGLRANPGNPSLLFELGRIYEENRGRTNDARNVWEFALLKFDGFDEAEQTRQVLLHAQLLGNLTRLEETAGNPLKAVGYLKRLQAFSPSGDRIQQWIDLLEERGRAEGLQ